MLELTLMLFCSRADSFTGINFSINSGIKSRAESINSCINSRAESFTSINSMTFCICLFLLTMLLNLLLSFIILHSMCDDEVSDEGLVEKSVYQMSVK